MVNIVSKKDFLKAYKKMSMPKRLEVRDMIENCKANIKSKSLRLKKFPPHEKIY